jgi:F-type H+-transporting ATPase subunit a
MSGTLSFLHLQPVLAAVDPSALPLVNQSFLAFLTNSLLVAGIVLLIILWASRKATKNMQLVPRQSHSFLEALSSQNFFEAVVEFFYERIEAIVGPKMAPKSFPLLATLFIFILIANWFGLIPGVGTIGWGESQGFGVLKEVHRPLLRPATADLNLTLGMALVVFGVWGYLTIKETGIIGFLKHTFGPKGGLTGLMGLLMVVIFFLVGIIEVVSILLRNLTLSMRLYGNVFAGENVLHTMSGMLDHAPAAIAFAGNVLLPLPFYFMELLVGILQAMVFTLLTAVYIKLSTDHGDEHHEGDAHH